MTQYQITALFQDGNSRTYNLNNNSKVSDLIQSIESDEGVQIPKDKNLSILYLGRFLEPSTPISNIEHNCKFTVNCFFRMKKTANDEENPLESELRGFDRLSRMGYSPAQIHDFRENFHRYYSSTNYPLNARIELEEEWFPSLFNGDEAPQFFLPNQNDENNRLNNDNDLNQNSDLDLSPDVEVPFDRSPSGSIEQPSWGPFYLGIAFGFVFRLNWYIFIPLMHPNKSILIGYLFGCGLFYMITELRK